MNELDERFSIPDLSKPEAFETLVPNTSSPPMAITWEKVQVANKLAFGGDSIAKVSRETGIPEGTIKRWLKNPEFVEYKNNLVLKAADTLKAENIALISKMINAKAAKIEANEGDYSEASNKDIATLIELRNNLLKDEKREEESSYSKKLEELLIKSSQRNIIEIKPEKGGE